MQFNPEVSFSEARELLRQYRENKERCSDEVLALSSIQYEKEYLYLGTERNLIAEQILQAAIDCHDYDSAYLHLVILHNEFPGSDRVILNHAAMLEAEGQYTKALEAVDNIITADETNAPARKRRVAILKAQGSINEAIKELVDYLKKFMADAEAWQELCELYLTQQEYARAAFCAEEMILHQPHNHLMHQRLADIRYTMGGVENMELAKSYYSHALKLNPDNLRALLGLFLATNNLVGQYKSGGAGGAGAAGGRRREAWRLSRWAQAQAASRPRGKSLTQLMLNLAIAD